MNFDEFEQRLQGQQFRPLPGDWKAEILNSTSGAKDASRRAALFTTTGAPSQAWWRELFWPHPVAWAGMAAAWIVLGVLHLMMARAGLPPAITTASVPSRELRLVLAEQRELRRELLEFTGGGFQAPGTREAESSPLERPRSSRDKGSASV